MNVYVPEPGRILLVEEEPVAAATIRHSLRDLGFEVAGVAADAATAIEMAGKEKPDLVLMNMQLGGDSDGIRTAETIGHIWNIPTVFLTAQDSEETHLMARSAGALGFLALPYRNDDLNATLRIVLQQHRLSQKIFAEHNWLTSLLASLADGVIATDAAGCVRYINPMAEAMTLWKSDEAIGKPIEQVYALSYLDGTRLVNCQLRRALAAQRSIPKERFLMRTKDGRKVPVEDAASPIFEEEHLVGAVTIFRDVTAQLETEEEERREHGRLETQVLQTTAALEQTKDQLRALYSRLITAQEDERRRLARELHDDLSQLAALMVLRIAELGQTNELMAPDLHKQMTQLRQNSESLANGLREVSHRLHPAVIDDLGLEHALRGLVEQKREDGADITIVTRDIPSAIPIEVATAFYRIAQEALYNAARHAPGAPILLLLSAEDGELMLTIEDPGPGFDMDAVRGAGGMGLLSMQERARIVGASMEIRSAPDEGTMITVRMKLIG